MAKLQQLRELAAEMGLKGQDVMAFVREQENSREERRLQREADAAARSADDRAWEHELEIIRLTPLTSG